VETKGVYIQDVVFPEEMVEVLTRREIANQQRATYEEQQRAETARIEMEKARGMADMQAELASAQVSIEIKGNRAKAREAEAGGEAAYVRLTGQAEADRVRAVGLAEAAATEALGVARAAGFTAQRDAIGETPTALVALANAVAEGKINIMPDILVTGGEGRTGEDERRWRHRTSATCSRSESTWGRPTPLPCCGGPTGVPARCSSTDSPCCPLRCSWTAAAPCTSGATHSGSRCRAGRRGTPRRACARWP
jgi:hypothetical protein